MTRKNWLHGPVQKTVPLNTRVPKDLMDEIKQKAKDEGRYLYVFIETVIRAGLQSLRSGNKS